MISILIVLDLAIVVGSWNAAYWLRFQTVNFPPAPLYQVTQAALDSALSQGLPREAGLALLNQAGGAFGSPAELASAVGSVLAPLSLESFAAGVVAASSASAAPPPFAQYARVTPILLILAAVAFYLRGVYLSSRFASFWRELRAVLEGCVLVVFLAMAATFLYRDFEYSRMHMVYFAACLSALIFFERGTARLCLWILRRNGWLVRRFVLIGDSPLAASFLERWKRHGTGGFKLVGQITPGARRAANTLPGVPVLGSVRDLMPILERHGVDQVVSALTVRQHSAALQVHRLLAGHYVDYQVVPDLGTPPALRMTVESFEGLPMIAISQGPLRGWNQVFKRGMDLFGSLFAIALFSPLLIALPLFIKLTSPGPVFYIQERMGWNGKIFRMAKFRTMRTDAEARSGPVWAKAGDARVTAIGRILRKTSLDEIPQFFNVLAGDMSLVGPRPERPVFIHEFRKRIPGYMARHKVKAGITGWAQVNGWRGNTSLEKRIQFDLFYISNWSIRFDLRILFMTVFKGFTHRNAY